MSWVSQSTLTSGFKLPKQSITTGGSVTQGLLNCLESLSYSIHTGPLPILHHGQAAT